MGRLSCWPGGCLAVALLVGLAVGTAPADPPEKKALEQQQQAENERLRAENKALGDLIRKRDKDILKLTVENARLRVERVAAAAERDLARKRVESLVQRVQELEKAKAAAAAKGPDGPNPPPAQVKGVIEKVKEGPKGGTLVQISIGSDAGLAVGHTLEVYRLQPRPQYLGMIRIVTVEARRAVGQRVPPRGGAPLKEVRPGDHVASSLQP